MGRSILSDMESGEVRSSERRLLTYLLLDTSGSMCGAPIAAVQDGVETMKQQLENTPEAVDTLHIAVITFNNVANVDVPLTPITSFGVPNLTSGCGGSTNMAAALELVNRQIESDFRPNRGGEAKGDYKPLVFLLTDGAPDDLAAAIAAGDKLKNRSKGNTLGTFMALGCGSGANETNLKQIASSVALMADMTPEKLKKFFVWMTASLTAMSKHASASAKASVDSSHEMEAPPIPKDSNDEAAFTFSF